jgi:hypothetical protein
MLIVAQIALAKVKEGVCREEVEVCYYLRHIKGSNVKSPFALRLCFVRFCFFLWFLHRRESL